MPAWPAGLPRPRAEGFRDEGAEGYVAFRADKPGAESRRQVTTAAPYRMSFSLSVVAAQTASLFSFYRDDLGFGTQRFTFAHPVTGGIVTAQFERPPARSPHSGRARWLLSIDLKYWP